MERILHPTLPDWIKVGDGFGYSRLEADGQNTCPDPIYRQFGIPLCKHLTLLLQHEAAGNKFGKILDTRQALLQEFSHPPILKLALQQFGCSLRKLHANYLHAVMSKSKAVIIRINILDTPTPQVAKRFCTFPLLEK
jgi:hypothetical protein